MKKKILVAMSGGIDSSSAASILKENGFEVHGAFMRVWQPASVGSAFLDANEDDARRVAERLDIPFYVFDVRDEFKREVVEYFKNEYLSGRTPNPCIVCNKKIKFDLFLQRAQTRGITTIATGHYVIGEYDDSTQSCQLREGSDPAKDQSYFLYRLSQHQLRSSVFPLGTLRKEQIRQRAYDKDFFTGNKAESQEICFIPDQEYGSFLKEEFDLPIEPGAIIDTAGKKRGEHKGYVYYTVGQRRGLGVSSPQPLYVVAINAARNEIIVGSREETVSSTCSVTDLHWIEKPPQCPSVNAAVRIRYNQQKIPSRVTVNESGARIDFIGHADVVTPGQAAVLYEGDRVLGGGWITA